MKTVQEIRELLSRAIPANAVHPADMDAGIYGDYVTAQWAMQEANEVFDLDGIQEFELLKDDLYVMAAGHYVFVATVQVRFAALDDEGRMSLFTRVGRGVGVARCPRGDSEPMPQQVDTAAKAALSDAIKNALMRTGRYLGAELYFNEREAQVLGYENFTSRKEREEERLQTTDLGSEVCPGFGKENKYEGMTLEQMYADPDAHGAMRWASGLEEPRGFAAKMAAYYNQQMALGEARAEQIKAKEKAQEGMVEMWYGDMKQADETVNWDKLVNSEGFNEMLAEKLNPDGGIANFGPNHPRAVNHYKRHFGIESGRAMTWGMLQALYTFCKEGSDKAAFAWPEYYADDRAPTEKTLEQEKEGQVSIEPEVIAGVEVPGTVMSAIALAGVPDPESWLETVMGERVPEEWGSLYTEIIDKITASIVDQKVEPTDTFMAGTMWGVAIDTHDK